MNKHRLVFFGTSEFAVPILESIVHSDKFELVGVVTQPDKPVGRKQILTPPAVKKFLQDNKIETTILQPEKLRKDAQSVLALNPDIILTASYGQIVPKEILEFPKYKALNVHVSILPHLRGAVPIPMAILEGLEETGVTIQIMSEEVDEGDILHIEKFPIDPKETSESLFDKSSAKSALIIEKVLLDWIEGKVEPVEQDHSKATYCKMSDIEKEKAEITFKTPVQIAERMVRAFYPWPNAWIRIPNGPHSGKRFKIYSAKISSTETADFFEIYTKDKKIFLSLAEGVLELEDVQMEGKSRGLAANYLWLV